MYKDGAFVYCEKRQHVCLKLSSVSFLSWPAVCILQGIKVTRLNCTQCGTPNPDPPPPPEPEPVPETSPKRKMWNRKGEEIEPPPLKLNEKEKTLLKKFLQLKLNNAWQGWKGWWVENKRYPALVCTASCPSRMCQIVNQSLVVLCKHLRVVHIYCAAGYATERLL